MRTRRLSWTAAMLLSVAAGSATAQSNADPEVDVSVFSIRAPSSFGREGVFPTGRSGFAFETTCCNTGLTEPLWRAPMNRNHPFISFLIARERNGRFEQISDRSYVKHGISAANAAGCGNCTQISTTVLGLGCTDTYTAGLNADRFTLGPPDEINPWEGAWTRRCGLFDRGEPSVGGAQECDAVRSLTFQMANSFGPVENRIEIEDADLDVTGAQFYAMTYYAVAQEPDANREDNMGHRRVTPNWNGNRWNWSNNTGLQHGSILERWSGATVTSATNGNDDGRVYVGVRVTEPTPGTFHYEYAFHNRDNDRGVGTIRIPFCGDASLANVGFHDVDQDPSNAWTYAVEGDELVVTTPDNPLRWNSVHNLWFDTDAAPQAGSLELFAFDPGPGAASFAVTGTVPTGRFERTLPAGCDGAPTLLSNGRATIGNAAFAVSSAGNVPGRLNLLVASFGSPGAPDANLATGGCRVWPSNLGRAPSIVVTGAGGVANHALPIPNQVGLEGLDLVLQCYAIQSSAGPRNQRRLVVSDGLVLRLGSVSTGCP